MQSREGHGRWQTAALIMTLAAGMAVAQTQPFWEWEQATGDWGGARDALVGTIRTAVSF